MIVGIIDKNMRLFNTKEEAQAEFEITHNERLQVIRERGDIVLRDDSHVGRPFFNGEMWTYYMCIFTIDMVEDLRNFQPLNREI